MRKTALFPYTSWMSQNNKGFGNSVWLHFLVYDPNMNVTIALKATVEQYSFSSQQWSEHKTILDKIQHDNYNCKYCIQNHLTTLCGVLHDTIRKHFEIVCSETHQLQKILNRQVGHNLCVSQLPTSPVKEPQSFKSKFSCSQLTYKITCKIRAENMPLHTGNWKIQI